MVALSFIRLAAGVGGLALSLAAGGGVASAQPDFGPVLYTTCTYAQVVNALNTQAYSPAGAQFEGSSEAQYMLRAFLASPLDVRQQMLQQAQDMPGAMDYAGLVLLVANTCNGYPT